MQNKTSALILPAAILAVIILFLFNAKPAQTVKDVQYFHNGEMLLPDYAITDTLIVIDAASLNKEIGAIEQGIVDGTDGDISEIFYKYCSVK